MARFDALRLFHRPADLHHGVLHATGRQLDGVLSAEQDDWELHGLLAQLLLLVALTVLFYLRIGTPAYQ